MKFLVYGTLRKNFGNSILFKQGNSKWLGVVKTEPIFTMYSLGGFPAVSEKGTTSITGEVWETDDENVINSVFRLEGCTRVQKNPENWYDFIEIDTEFGKANMFIMNNLKNRKVNIVESGDWDEYKRLQRSY